jgi:hypothetical protein
MAYSSAESIDWYEEVAIFFSIMAIPLLVLVLIILALRKGGADINNAKSLESLEKVTLVISMLAFVFYCWSFSWIGFSAFVISVIIANFFLGRFWKEISEKE